MGTKAKTLDCVEMKRRAQAELRAEYEAHKADYASEIEFLNAKARARRAARREAAEGT